MTSTMNLLRRHSMARPTIYKEEYNEQVYKLCLLGHTDKELAEFFGIQESTLNLWKNKHPEFMESIKKGKEIADTKVVESLYKRATGYSKMSTQFATFKGRITDRVDYTEEVAPDVTAGIFWLKNRQGRNWREKQELATTVKTYSLFEDDTENKAKELELNEQSKKAHKK